jgi:hypothetical protein
MRPDCPPDLRVAIMRMLEKSPADRFPTMRDAAQSIGGRVSGAHAPDEDNIRSHIGLLAGPRPSRPMSEMRRTPSSAISLPRVAPPPISTRTRQRRVRLTRILAGLMLAAMGAAVAFVVIEARDNGVISPPVDSPTVPTGPTAEELKADSLLRLARGGAEYARQRAVASRIDSLALRTGDSLVKEAEALVLQGQKSGATVLIYRAITLWTAAERPRVAPESAAGTPPVVPLGGQRPTQPATTPGRTETYTTPSVSDSMQAVQFYDELKRAIESRQLGEVRRLLPNFSTDDERMWRGWFEDKSIKSMEATFAVRYTSRLPDETNTIYARVQQVIRARKENGKSERKKESLEYAKLTLGPQGWRQISSEKLKP